MSNNLNAVSGVYKAFAACDIPAVLAVFSENIHWTEPEGVPKIWVTDVWLKFSKLHNKVRLTGSVMQ